MAITPDKNSSDPQDTSTPKPQDLFTSRLGPAPERPVKERLPRSVRLFLTTAYGTIALILLLAAVLVVDKQTDGSVFGSATAKASDNASDPLPTPTTTTSEPTATGPKAATNFPRLVLTITGKDDKSKSFTICGDASAAAPAWPDATTCARLDSRKTSLFRQLSLETKELTVYAPSYDLKFSGKDWDVPNKNFTYQGSGARVKLYRNMLRALGTEALVRAELPEHKTNVTLP